jgi:hypothetical protein
LRRPNLLDMLLASQLRACGEVSSISNRDQFES